IRDAFESKGCSFRYDSITNQQFPIIPNEYLEKLKDKYSFSFWEKTDENHTAVRFCTSWATKEEDVEALISDIIKL
ncbi:low specificity L-threonine aldolase, partial [Clostridium butyricum]